MIDLKEILINSNYKKETGAVSYTHLRAHETVLDLVCRLLLENQIGTELPWVLIKQSDAKDIIFLEG